VGREDKSSEAGRCPAPRWLRFCSLAILIAAGLIFNLCLVLDTSRHPVSAAIVLPLLLVFGAAIILGAYSLVRLRSLHQRTDQAFRETDREFSSIFQAVLDGILILDNESNCLDGNPAAASILRVPRNELIGKNIRSFLRDPTGWQSILQHNGLRERIELVASDGTTVFVQVSGAWNYLPGRHIFILCDISGRTHAEKSLKKSEERFRYVADHIQEIVWRMNTKTKEIVYVNQAYTSITGYSVESLYKAPLSYQKLVYPQDRMRVLARLRDAVRAGNLDEEFRFRHANGSVRWIRVKASRALVNGNSHWLVGTALDITTRKQAEQQILEHLDAAETARAEAKALSKATLTLSQNLAMDSALDTLLQCIRELVPFDRASVLFVEDATHLMIAREAGASLTKHGTAGSVLTTFKNPCLQRVLSERKPILLSNTNAEPGWINAVPFDGARSWIGIPLTSAGSIIGILSLCAHRPAAFTPEHRRLARNLAVSAAVAIQNARVYERAKIYATELELRIRELQLTQTPLVASPGPMEFEDE
jgi:PAS domain S-box-containing protein